NLVCSILVSLSKTRDGSIGTRECFVGRRGAECKVISHARNIWKSAQESSFLPAFLIRLNLRKMFSLGRLHKSGVGRSSPDAHPLPLPGCYPRQRPVVSASSSRRSL